MSEVYLLVEGLEEIAQAEDMRAQYFPQGIVYISLSSPAKSDLVSRGVKHINGYDLCDLMALSRATDDHYESLRHQCREWDAFLQQQFPILLTHDVQPLFFNYYNIKLLLDTIKQRACIVESAYHKFGERLYAFSPDVKTWTRYLKLEDRFTGYLLREMSGEEQIISRARAVLRPPAQRATSIDIAVAGKLRWRRNTGRNLWARIVRKAKQVLSARQYTPCIYSISPVIPFSSLARAGLRRQTVSLDHVRASDFSCLSAFEHPSFAEMLSYASPASGKILQEWLNACVLSQVMSMVDRAQHWDALIKKDEPLLLESRTFFAPDEQIIASRFLRHGKRVVGYNHGSLGTQIEKMFGIGDLHYVSDYFVWGDGVREYIEDQYPYPLGRDISIHVSGTDHFETDAALTRHDLCQILNIPDDKTIVLLPGSGFGHNIFYNWYLLMSEQQEYEAQLRIIDFFSQRSDCVFIYKGLNSPHYDEGHVKRYIEDKKVDNLFYMNETRLRYILPAIDVLMTDRPSTSLLEALSSHKICYSCNRWMTFPGDSRALYERACQHFFDAEAMLEKFSIDLQNGFSQVPRDPVYFERYGNALTVKEREAVFDDFLAHALEERKPVV